MRCKQCKYEWVYVTAAAQPVGTKAQSLKVKHDELYANALKLKSKRSKLPKLSTLFFLIPLGLLVLGVGLTWLLFHDYWVKGWRPLSIV